LLDGRLLVDLEQLAARSWQDRLTILVREAINAGWITGDAVRIAGDIVQKNYIRRRAGVATKATLEERLLAAVGGTAVAFLPSFDDAVRRAIELKPALDPVGVARLALAVHGPTALAVVAALGRRPDCIILEPAPLRHRSTRPPSPEPGRPFRGLCLGNRSCGTSVG
jgi:hypothetical protein